MLRTVIGSSLSIVGILNVTPDSYFDGGEYDSVERALKRAQVLVNEGADIIEIGGESTGPGSVFVSEEEEMRRVASTVSAVVEHFPDVRISVDTYKSAVALECARSGATMINDVTAGRGDERMFDVIAQSDVDCVLMYSKDSTARTTIENTAYEDVIQTVCDFLKERISQATAKGVSSSRIIVDPGLGHFVSADPVYSFHILSQLKSFAQLGPVFVSPSRKSFLAGSQNLPPAERLPATLAASTVALQNGASFIRTHDVRATVLACEAAHSMRF